MPDHPAASDSGNQPQHSDLPRDHGKSAWQWMSLAIIAVLVIALAGVTAALVVSNSDESEDTAASAATSPFHTLPLSASTSPSAPAQPVMDAAGWHGTAARCEEPNSPMVTARTVDTLMVVCSGPDGLVYKHVRESDGSTVSIDEVDALGWAYIATDVGKHYGVTTTELTISSGDAILYQSPFVESRGNTLSARPTTASPPTLSTRTTVPPQSESTTIERGEANDSSGDDSYGRYGSYGEYSTHFQCVAFNTPSEVCSSLIEKYGSEAEP
ncbi:hypothetical protein NWP13_22030 [Rhodococcus pyridinivorans]|nr:hypothetical protein [Rhodococcus pyridinivorans]